MCSSARLKECCCGCSIRTGALIVLWLDAALSSLMGMLYLISSHGMSAGINIFKSLAEYSYNGAKFFQYQSKSFGGDANIKDFEEVYYASQRIDPLFEHYGKIIGSILFYWNMIIMLIAVIGIVAVHQRKQFPLLIYGAIKVIEILVTIFVVFTTCFKMQLPSIWLVAFPGIITIALKMYGTMVVHSHWGEIIQYSASENTSTSEDDVEFAKKKSLRNNKQYDL